MWWKRVAEVVLRGGTVRTQNRRVCFYSIICYGGTVIFTRVSKRLSSFPPAPLVCSWGLWGIAVWHAWWFYNVSCWVFTASVSASAFGSTSESRGGHLWIRHGPFVVVWAIVSENGDFKNSLSVLFFAWVLFVWDGTLMCEGEAPRIGPLVSENGLWVGVHTTSLLTHMMW